MNLDIKELRGGYGAKLVLDNVNFSIVDGSVVSIIGPNGSGKSTLLKMIGRVLRPLSGSIILDGASLADYQTGDLAKMMAMLPQLHQAATSLTVEELVACGRFPHRRPFGFRCEQDRQAIDTALAMTRLQSYRRHAVNTLSGGERQRAWIAMTLAQQPRLLLLDEPTTFLDVCCQLEILDLVRQLNRRHGVTVIMVLHDLNLAAACSDQMIMLKNGQIRHAGTPRGIMTEGNLREVFEIHAKITLSEHGVPSCQAIGPARNHDLPAQP